MVAPQPSRRSECSRRMRRLLDHLNYHELVGVLLVGLHLVGDLCVQGRGTFNGRGRFLWVLRYDMTPRVLLHFLGKPGLVVDPRLGESDVHLVVVPLEPDHIHGVVLVLVFRVSCSPGCFASTWTAATPGLRSSSSRRTQCSACSCTAGSSSPSRGSSWTRSPPRRRSART